MEGTVRKQEVLPVEPEKVQVGGVLVRNRKGWFSARGGDLAEEVYHIARIFERTSDRFTLLLCPQPDQRRCKNCPWRSGCEISK